MKSRIFKFDCSYDVEEGGPSLWVSCELYFLLQNPPKKYSAPDEISDFMEEMDEELTEIGMEIGHYPTDQEIITNYKSVIISFAVKVSQLVARQSGGIGFPLSVSVNQETIFLLQLPFHAFISAERFDPKALSTYLSQSHDFGTANTTNDNH